VFLVNVPVGLAVAVLAPRFISKDKTTGNRSRLDLGGAALVTLAAASTVFALSEGTALGWTSLPVAVSFAAAIACAAGFVAVERRHDLPLVRLELLRIPALRSAGALTFLVGLWVAGEMLVLSYYLQGSLHDSALFTGLAIAPQGMVGFTAGYFGPRLSARFGVRRLLVLTGASATAGFLILSHLPTSGAYSPALVAVVLVGFGTAGTAFGSTILATANIANADQGLVGGVINTTRQIGAAIGAALLLSIAEGGHGAGGTTSVAGDRHAMLAGAGAAALATVVAWRSGRTAGSISSSPRLRGSVSLSASSATRAA
jgi:predicted MFS family arabinose efflux permease